MTKINFDLAMLTSRSPERTIVQRVVGRLSLWDDKRIYVIRQSARNICFREPVSRAETTDVRAKLT
jgi:hypothetical protein